MANGTLQLLNSAIYAVCPIDGVSVGRFNDKATWRIDFSAGATAPQKAAAAAVVAGFDVNAVTPPVTLDQIYDQAILSQQVLKAVILALNDGTLPVGTNKTAAQLKAIIKAKM